MAAAAAVFITPTIAAASTSAVKGVGGSGASVRTSSGQDTTAVGTIAFELGAPCEFAKTAPLREQYSSLGVHFRGASAGMGGAVLDECSGFVLNARSGSDFLAFASDTYATPPEFITFDDPQRGVQLYVSANGGTGTSTFTLTARQTDGTRVTATVTASSSGYVPLRVTSSIGIDAVRLTGQTPDGAFVVDDLKFASL